MHFAYRQSIIVGSSSSLCWTVWERKLVSMRTEYGGTRAVLYWKKREEETWGLLWTGQLELGNGEGEGGTFREQLRRL